MNNIPVYFSSGGTASLILREIPFSGRAYILLRTFFPGSLNTLVKDCCDFCRDAGAKECYISSADGDTLSGYPHAYDIYYMVGKKALFPPVSGEFTLRELTKDNEKTYLEVYNRCFSGTSHAAGYDYGQLQRIYRTGQKAFLAYTPEGELCGMGELHDNELAAVGLLPEFRGKGLSSGLTLSLLQHCPGEEITLTVVSDNDAAIALYESLSFRISKIESHWYKA